jgi:signal transduction histidine kinase/CheY-like chemotaxis protein/HPt (histidine-containing phosphotransfer) domain-containing protein
VETDMSDPQSALEGPPLDTAASPGSVLSMAQWFAAAAGLLGLLVLVGWLYDVAALRTLVPGAVQMKANTAVALLMAAGSLYVQGNQFTRRQLLTAQVFAAAVATIGAATLAEYLFGWKLGIDELLFVDTSKAFNPIRGRMSPYSAIVFIAFGAALIALSRPRLRALSRSGAMIAAIIGAASILGYLWNASELTTDMLVPPLALNTSLAFLLLGAGLLSVDRARTDPSDTGATEHGGVETKVLFGFVAALALLYLAGGITYRMGVNFADSARWVTYTQDVRAQLGELYGSISNAESAQRNYLLTGVTEYRLEYMGLAPEVDERVIALNQLLRDDPQQLVRLGVLHASIAARMSALTQNVETFEESGSDAVRSSLANSDGINAMKSIRNTIRIMDAAEAKLLAARSAQLVRSRSLTLYALIATLAVATVALILLFRSITRDIRERARIARALDHAQREAERATRAKSEFLAAMSHEIRTPMNGVSGMIDVLLQSSLMGPQIEMANLIRESADSLLTIIDDILDFSKIEAGHLELERAPMAIAAVVEKTCGLLNRLAERKGGTLTVFVDPAIALTVLGDAARLRQVLVNLIGNAIKFSCGLSRPGRVSVRAVLIEGDAAHAVVEFRVCDNGIGMDETTQAKVFNPFTQADASTTRKFGGTGLGLTISRQLAALMGGSISIKSAADSGSTFTVRVPFDVVATVGSSETRSPEIKGLTCLVIGGQGCMADDLAAYLRADAASVARVPDLAAAHEWTRSQSAGMAVWVVDAGEEMPGPAELEAAIRARSDPALRVVLVVIGSGRRRSPRAEANGFIIIDGNALNRHALAKAVAMAAGRDIEDAELQSVKQRAAAPALPTRAEAIEQRKLILVAEDNEINQKVIRQQLHLLGYAVDVAQSGGEALRRWHSGEYALLLTDLHMPEVDGYDLALAIRLAEGGRSHMPIVALTANALAGEADRCRAVGMDGYLSKPAALSELAALLERWLPTQILPQSRPVASDAPMDISLLEALVGTDPLVVQDVLQDFGASAASLALQLSDSCATGRGGEAAAIAHRLKSSARSVGALKLGDLCAAIESAGADADATALQQLKPQFETEMASVSRYLRSLPLREPPADQCA